MPPPTARARRGRCLPAFRTARCASRPPRGAASHWRFSVPRPTARPSSPSTRRLRRGRRHPADLLRLRTRGELPLELDGRTGRNPFVRPHRGRSRQQAPFGRAGRSLVGWNIPASVTSLREGLQKQDRLEDPPGLRQGPGSNGAAGYRGPRPPGRRSAAPLPRPGLRARSAARPAGGYQSRDEVLAAMKGHVRARGELIGTFKRPDSPAKP